MLDSPQSTADFMTQSPTTQILIGVAIALIGGAIGFVATKIWGATSIALTRTDVSAVVQFLSTDDTAKNRILDTIASDPRFKPTDGIAAPIGAIIAWPGKSLPTDGVWLPCQGQELDSTEKGFPKLADVLGTTYGKAGKPNHIKLPNFQGMFLRGAGERRGSAPIGEKQLSQVGHHDHDVDLGKYHVARYAPGGDTDNDPNGARAHQIHVKGRTEVHNPNGETRPVNYAVHWIIRVK